MEDTHRIDKWLWCVRLFKTRTQAVDACRGGKVKVNQQSVKPSREIHPGDVLIVNTGLLTRTIRVVALLPARVSARLVSGYMEDLTPAAEYEKLQMMRELNHEKWDRGVGRPTKKDRRRIVKLKNKTNE
ncbi:MAG TPA: RNA-binding S4 domain-containing protein [Bacteroidales bacterium]|nr:RNA-binding S4 domain-containing protein [Bacteroidales bacterium]HSA44798.1 RNA-binding S4 domain-containing protein [Bacteroidales bacterium]